ncbi:MAG: serine hydrolase, partial [Planctomycetota bacterium]
MRVLLTLLLLAWTSLFAAADLPRAMPESRGVSSAGVLRFVERADAEIDVMNSFMLVRHGHVVAEGWWDPYRPEDRHQLYSLSKSFTSIALGIAIDEGKLTLDDRVVDWFPDRLPAEPSDHLRPIRVRDLLRMTTGHVADDLAGFRWGPGATVERFLSLPVTLKPGTHFTYNTPATYTASAVLQQATGETTHEYLKPRLLEPLGIIDTWWEATPEGVTMGGSGLSVRTEAIAKFGQLLLQRGEWRGEQLVPAEWIDAATAMQTPTGSDPTGDWDQG